MATKTDIEKLKNLTHYICHKVSDPAKLGKTKLNKILYYSDMLYYLHHLQPITGETYIKKQFGPASKHLDDSLHNLKNEGKITEREQAVFDFTRQELVSLKKPDISGFSGEEIALIDEVIQAIAYNHTAESISDLSHDETWEITRYEEEIPYFTILGHTVPPSDEALAWAHRKIKEKYGVEPCAQ
jgi:uncharacterized protein YwgA